MNVTTHALIERYYVSFNATNWDAFLSYLTEDVVHDVNQGRREIGRPAFKRFMEHMNECYRERVENIIILTSDDGARAAAEFTVTGQYKKTDGDMPPARGQVYNLSGGAFFSIRGGKIARVSSYYNVQDWIRQVGS